MIPSTNRRSLLAGAGVLTSGVLAGGRALGQEPRKLGYAIVGLGGYANVIMPRFAECRHSRLTALVSGDPAKALRIAAEYGVPERNIYDYSNFDRIRDNPDVDIVYVILPVALHHEYTLRAAAAGKHVLCEKPMAMNAGEAAEMIAACRAANVKLMIGYRSWFESHNREAMRMTQAGELGPVRLVTSQHGFNIGDPDQWRLDPALSGGGSMMDIGIYSLQSARYLTGEEPVEVAAFEQTDRSDPRFRAVEDTLLFQMRFPSGAMADCVSSYSSNHGRSRAVGAAGWLDMEPATGYGGHRTRVHLEGRTREHEPPALPVNQFSGQLDHLSQCVLTGAEPIVPGEEGLRDMRIIEALYQAARERRPVAL